MPNLKRRGLTREQPHEIHRNQQRRPVAAAAWAPHRLVIFAMALAACELCGRATGQCLDKTMTSFERIGGVTIKDAQLTILYQANMSQATIGHHHGGSALAGSHLNSSASQLGSSSSSGGPTTTTLYQISTPITAECNNRCRRSKSCRAFLVDYGRHTCWSVNHQPGGGGPGGVGNSMHLGGGGHQSVAPISSFSALDRAPTPIHLVPTNERTAYFEKVCLNLPIVECERAWIFERVLSYHIPGHDDKIIDDVSSRLKCQEHCLNERSFRCRSGEYDHLTMQCRLSMVDRHMKQNLFRPTANNVDYFENQCVPTGNQCDAFDRFEDMDLGRAEIMRLANNSEQCQQFCTQTIKAFICRSFTWSPLTGRCYLNSVNTFMVGGMDKLLPAPGLVYYQRNECIDLKLECDTTAMTLNLRTNEPFRGRMYVRDDPNACETLGRSALLSSLSIPFQSPMGRCATRELPSRYSSVVVVQQHPLIQRKSDRYIKLVCDFQTANKTITSHYNVMANPWTSTALINATSFAPKILLRITDKFGNDITGAKLGDELQLRIEAETDSVYDMVARSVLAKSGTTDESIVLIDRDGCPADFRIFPPLKKISKRVIIGRFDAFKFSSDVVVRFQVDVQFCLNSCPPTNCLDQQHAGGSPAGLFNVNSQQLDSAAAGNQLGEGPLPAGSTSGPTGSSPSSQQSGGGGGLGEDPNEAYNSLGSPSSTTHRPPAQLGSPSTGGQQQQQQQQDYLSTTNAALPAEYGGADANSLLSTRRGQPPANQPLGGGQAGGAATGNGAPSSDQLFDSAQAKDSGRLLMSPGDHSTFRPLHMHQQQQHKMQQYNKQMYSGDHLQQRDADQPAGSPGETSAANQQQQLDLQQQGQQGQDQQQQNSHKRRRRRSTEPLPSSPKHVPLQREIIVIESSSDDGPTAGGRGGIKSSLANGKHSARSQRDMKTAPGEAKAARAVATQQHKEGLNANKYDLQDSTATNQLGLAGSQDELEASGSLVCTTWTSLGFSLAAFCAIQLLTLGVCLATWAHNQRTRRHAQSNQHHHQATAAAAAAQQYQRASAAAAGQQKLIFGPLFQTASRSANTTTTTTTGQPQRHAEGARGWRYFF